MNKQSKGRDCHIKSKENKTKSNYILSTKNKHFIQRCKYFESVRLDKNNHANSQHKKVIVVLLILDKITFKKSYTV